MNHSCRKLAAWAALWVCALNAPLGLAATPPPAAAPPLVSSPTGKDGAAISEKTPLNLGTERNVFLDFGFGIPALFFFQGQAMLNKHWQLGFGYGTLPGFSALASGIKLPRQTVTLQGGVDVTTEPLMDANYNSLMPFIRWYPRADGFYVQFSWTMLRATAEFSGDLVDSITDTAVGNISGDVTVLQPLPLLGVGHLFIGKRYFFNIMIGMSFFLFDASTSVETSSFIPASLGGNAANQAAIDDLQKGISAAINNSTAALKDRYPVIPSLALSFGIML